MFRRLRPSILGRFARREPLERRPIGESRRSQQAASTRRKLRGDQEGIGVGSRKRFQLVNRKPSALTLGGFHSVPVWCDNHDNDVGVSGKIGQVSSGTKWCCFQSRTRSFDPSLHFVTQRVYSFL